MNLDPRSSKNYKQAIKKNQAMNQGARFQVGDERLTAVQIAARAGCAVETVNLWLKQFNEDPQRFISRMQAK